MATARWQTCCCGREAEAEAGSEKGEDNGGGRSPSGAWDSSSRTLEDARAEGARRHDAAARRERALAYAYAYQQVRVSLLPATT